MPVLTLFHGRRGGPLDRFTEDGIGRGGDPNSALGAWLIPCPGFAADYASQNSTMLVVEAQLETYACFSGYTEFLGRADEVQLADRDDFRTLRMELMADGVDSVVYEAIEVEGEPIVVLDPKKLIIVKTLSYSEAQIHADLLFECDRDPETEFRKNLNRMKLVKSAASNIFLDRIHLCQECIEAT